MAILQRGHITAATPKVHDIRVLSRSDLTLLSEKRPPTVLQSIKDSHHRIARAMAAGLRTDEIAKLCGITTTRVSILRKDPALMELMAHYRGIVTAEYVRSVDSFMEVATGNMLKAATMISDKLDDAIDKGEYLPTRDLLAIHDTGADRFGYGKMQKNLNVNVDFASQLEQARKRSAQARTIEGVSSRPQSTPEPISPAYVAQGSPSFRRL